MHFVGEAVNNNFNHLTGWWKFTQVMVLQSSNQSCLLWFNQRANMFDQAIILFINLGQFKLIRGSFNLQTDPLDLLLATRRLGSVGVDIGLNIQVWQESIVMVQILYVLKNHSTYTKIRFQTQPLTLTIFILESKIYKVQNLDRFLLYVLSKFADDVNQDP